MRNQTHHSLIYPLKQYGHHHICSWFFLLLCEKELTFCQFCQVSTSMKGIKKTTSCQAAHLHSCWSHIRLHRKHKPELSLLISHPSHCALVSTGGKSSSFSSLTVFIPMCILTAQDSFDLTLNKSIVHVEKSKNLISASHIDFCIQPTAWVHTVCQSIHTLSGCKGKLFCCQRDNNGGGPIVRRCVLKQHFKHSSVFWSVITISECSDIRQEGGIKCQNRKHKSPVMFCTVFCQDNIQTVRYVFEFSAQAHTGFHTGLRCGFVQNGN